MSDDKDVPHTNDFGPGAGSAPSSSYTTTDLDKLLKAIESYKLIHLDVNAFSKKPKNTTLLLGAMGLALAGGYSEQNIENKKTYQDPTALLKNLNSFYQDPLNEYISKQTLLYQTGKINPISHHADSMFTILPSLKEYSSFPLTPSNEKNPYSEIFKKDFQKFLQPESELSNIVMNSEQQHSSAARDARIIDEARAPALEAALGEFVDKRPYLAKEILGKHARNETAGSLHVRRDFDIGYRRMGALPYCDGSYSFILSQVDPIAVIGFNAKPHSIEIVQIQGMPGKKERLSSIRWERALVDIVCDWAKANGIPTVTVVPHTRNNWPAVRKNGKLHYDVTAKRCGFKYDKLQDVYVKHV